MPYPQVYACSITDPPKDKAFMSLLATIHTKEKVWEYKSGDLDELPDIDDAIVVPQMASEIQCYFVRLKRNTGYVVWLKGGQVSAHLVFGFNSNVIGVDEKVKNPLLEEGKKDYYQLWIDYSHHPITDPNIEKELKSTIDEKLQSQVNKSWSEGLGKFMKG